MKKTFQDTEEGYKNAVQFGLEESSKRNLPFEDWVRKDLLSESKPVTPATTAAGA